MLKGWTIGCELELSDCQRDTPLPGRSTWDRHDYTIVNSNGVANDPLGKTWKFGGEVNCEPTESIVDQVNIIMGVLDACTPFPTANYRSNLHIHIRVPGLADNAEKVKWAIEFAQKNGPVAFAFTDPLPPEPADHESRVRWRRRKQSHHTLLSEKQMARITSAGTPEQIRMAHAPMSASGKPQYQLVQRCGVNFLSLWDHPPQTVEFRHFSLELNYALLYNAMEWCVQFLEAALGMRDAMTAQGPFPRQPLIDLELERKYQLTSPRYHPRPKIIALLEQWKREGSV